MRNFWGLLFSFVFSAAALSVVGCGGGSGSNDCEGSVCPCNEGGIRSAITEGGGAFTFDCGGPTTVVIDNEIGIDTDVSLDGGGNLTVDGNRTTRVFSIQQGVTVELIGLTVTNGNAGEEDGGGILNFGNLTLSNSSVTGNVVGAERGCRLDDFDLLCAEGGGIWSLGALTLIDSTVSGNSANFGGGIANRGDTMSLTDSVVSENSATGCIGPGSTACSGGGGIWNSGVFAMTGSTLSGNRSNFGGALYDRGAPTLNNSTITDNSADLDGGGLQSFASLARVVDCAFTDNDAGQSGGAISVATGALTIDRSTVAGNAAVAAGGGILVRAGATAGFVNTTVSTNVAETGGGIYSLGDVRLASCTIAGNDAFEGSGMYVPSPSSVRAVRNTVIEGDCGGLTLESQDYNVESPGDTCGFDQDGDQPNVNVVDLGLEQLADNGGPTETQALVGNSVAIDRVPAADCVDLAGEPLVEDQRREPRPGGGSSECDVGAFEVQ